MASTTSKKRNDLTLKLKYEVIKAAEREPGISSRTLAKSFDCGKTQIQTILKNKDHIKELYESNASDNLKQFRKRSRKSEYSEINDALYKWFQLASSKNIHPDGKILMEKAIEIAQRLGIDEFKASNGWLTRWKERYNVKQRVISGESGADTVESWLERLPSVIEGYEARDIWNCDETGLFWKALPDKGLAEKKKACKGGKKSKLRVTITFFVNSAGESECPPVVIWKSANPRCFKGVNKSELPVWYFSQKKSWMDSEILNEILGRINRKLVRDERSILLTMDNAGCHPHDLEGKFSNIKVVFLPANTTSKLQPLDLGIIKNFKTYYRKLFLRYLLTKIDQCSSATEISKSITILQAIRWTSEAWKTVESTSNPSSR